jgi:hypothetical protein
VVIILRMPLASTEAGLAARQSQPNVDVDDQRTGTYSAQGGSLTGAEHAQDPGATGEHQHRHTVSETEMGFPLIALCLIFREK